MKYLTTALVLSLFVFGCGEGHDHADHGDEGLEEHSEHASQHGGEMTILGDHAAHFEVKHDEAPVLNFVTDAGPQSITATEKDGAWVFSHEALKDEPQKARFLLKIGGKSYSPDFAHKH